MRVEIVQPQKMDAWGPGVRKVSAQGLHGSFSLLPRHVDTVAVLVPGLLWFEQDASQETFVAVDGGVLVKCGSTVRVSTRRAVTGPLGRLRELLEESFLRRSQLEEQADAAVTKLQADFVRRFVELERE